MPLTLLVSCQTIPVNKTDLNNTPRRVLYSPTFITLPAGDTLVQDKDELVVLSLDKKTAYVQISEYAKLEQKYLILLTKGEVERTPK